MSVDKRRFDAVIFDLDGTLLVDDNLTAVLETCAALATLHPEIEADVLAAANARAWAEYWPTISDDWILGRLPDGRVLSREAWSRALAIVGVRDSAMLDETVALHAHSVRRNLHLLDGAPGLLDAARATGAKLAVITNGALEEQTGKLRELGILDRFDVVMTSGEAGVMKPDPRIFALTLEALDVRADRAIHIGNSLQSDVGGAKGAGLGTVWLNEHGEPVGEGAPVADYEVRTLREVARILV